MMNFFNAVKYQLCMLTGLHLDILRVNMYSDKDNVIFLITFLGVRQVLKYCLYDPFYTESFFDYLSPHLYGFYSKLSHIKIELLAARFTDKNASGDS